MKSTTAPAAAALLALAAATAVPAVADDRLGGAELRRAFNGTTLDGLNRNGTFFTETYAADGSLRYHDIDGSDTGRWSVHGDSFCTFYEHQTGACFHVQARGANCYLFAPLSHGETDQAAGDWTSEGWNHALPATCASTPEVQI
jgi:hypothetical protein